MNLSTLSVYSTYSPILDHLGIDLWALVVCPSIPLQWRLCAEQTREGLERKTVIMAGLQAAKSG